MESGLTVVVGGGAAGIVAAISAARAGRRAVICEKTHQIGKKILATGNGRCNFLNELLDETHYNAASRSLVKSVFRQFGKREILDFFQGIGLRSYSQEGRVFPLTNQAASVLKVLEIELKRLPVSVEYGFNCTRISHTERAITVFAEDGRSISCSAVIVTGGGKTYPAFGSDGSIYGVAAGLGHTIIEPVPSAVPLVVRDPICQFLQGQRIVVEARSIIRGRESAAIRGELLFTKYGLSGSAVLDLSGPVSVALARDRISDIFLLVDMIPAIDEAQLTEELERRGKEGWPPDDMLAGILPNKFGPVLRRALESKNAARVAKALKAWRFRVQATRGWNEAEFTSGGVDTGEISHSTLESKLAPGVYFAGEVLDVDGERGGYNLAWAWASGFVAGLIQRERS